MNVRVAGVPDDAAVTLVASTSTGDLHSHNGAACQRRGGQSFVCRVTDDRTFRFGIRNQTRPTLTFTVSAPGGPTLTRTARPPGR